MNAPRLAFAALLPALAAAPAFSQNAPLIPVAMGPAASGQCVIGSAGCGLARGAAMDPVAEDALVGLGQRAVPTISLPEKKAPPIAAKDDSDAAGSETDLAAIGGRIINPLGPAAASGADLGAAPANPAAAGASEIEPAPVAKATGLAYTHSLKVEASLGGKESTFSGDPKLSAGDADFAPGGFGASTNGSR